MSTLLRGAAVAGVVALATAAPDTLGLPGAWPVLLAAAIAFARPFRAGIPAAALVGALVGWSGMALRAGVLADTAGARAGVALLTVGIVTAVAAATKGHLPLWSGLAGIALFVGAYEPVYALAPTHFVADSLLTLGGVVVALGLGSLAAVVAAAAARPTTERVVVLPEAVA